MKIKTLLAGDDGHSCPDCARKDAQIEALLAALSRQQAAPLVITTPAPVSTPAPPLLPWPPTYPTITCASGSSVVDADVTYTTYNGGAPVT